MKLLGIIIDDYINYKLPSMTLQFPYCSFKCNKDAGKLVCHNYKLAKSEIIDISNKTLIDIYMSNNLVNAVVMQGLEPLDSFDEVISFISEFRDVCNDDVVIYTGYTEKEVCKYVDKLAIFPNIIIKLGRFIPDSTSRFDAILGVKLASSNQYAIKLN